MYILFKGQKKLEIFKIAPNHQKILWINISAPSLGDSLMDLSSRVMLKNREIDLFTDLKNAHLYLDDKYLRKIYTNSEDVRLIKYDLVILDSYSTRSMKMKVSISPNIKYVGLFGFFNGPEVNRTLFSFHQMNHLLAYPKSEEEINKISNNIITISNKDKKIVREIIPKIYITIVVGGEWKYKIYKKWGDLIEEIISGNEKINIVLIGSKNAQNESKELLERFDSDQFFNLVSKLSFNQTAEVIKQSQVVICCDGGLMHAATAVGASIIAILARLSPEMLFANANSLSLFDNKDVNNINVEDILLEYDKLTSLFDNHLQGE
jgi:heptosyltransferase-2